MIYTLEQAIRRACELARKHHRDYVVTVDEVYESGTVSYAVWPERASDLLATYDDEILYVTGS